jgi:hypothetical protein
MISKTPYFDALDDANYELLVPTHRSRVDELERGTIHTFNVSSIRLSPELETKVEDKTICIGIEIVYSKNPHHQSVMIVKEIRTVQERPGPAGTVEKTWTTYRETKNYRVRDGVDALNDNLWVKLLDHYKPSFMSSSWHTADETMSAQKEADVITAIGQG